MYEHLEKPKENKGRAIANSVAQKKRNVKQSFGFVDNRPEAKQNAQQQATMGSHSAQQHQLIQKKGNNTGLPDNSKTEIENLPDYSMDGVMGVKANRMVSPKVSSLSSSSAHNSTVQRIALYHGAAKEDANAIVSNGIDPTRGKGEFGQGYYTVFSPDQAKHIAMYYWNSEHKYNDGKTGVGVVKTSIPDDWWKDLMSTADEGFDIEDRTEDRWYNSRSNPFEGRDGTED
ncbi:MAG: hypothetical protein JXR53_15255 [Bacteroidales bacterium]|nr:hypothetical protein [Bacteroidales bacterium]